MRGPDVQRVPRRQVKQLGVFQLKVRNMFFLHWRATVTPFPSRDRPHNLFSSSQVELVKGLGVYVLVSTQALARTQKNHSECISFLLQKMYSFERLIVSTRSDDTIENMNKNVTYKTLPSNELDAIRGNDLLFLDLAGQQNKGYIERSGILRKYWCP